MADEAGVVIRTMTKAEVPFAIGEAAREGWNPGRHDAACFYEADPEGFLVADLDGTPVGCVAAIRYGDRYGFLGLFIVAERFRGMGIGMRLWDAAVERLDGRVAGLDGVVAMQAAYADSGFVLAHRNIRYSGRVSGRRSSALDCRPIAEVEEIREYDEPLFGGPRQKFLAAWLAQRDVIALAARVNGELRGYAVARACRQGTKIGPLFADDPQIAEGLLDAVAARLPEGSTLIVDVPEPNAAATFLVQAKGMQPGFETARMYRGGDPGLPLKRVFGITTLELG